MNERAVVESQLGDSGKTCAVMARRMRDSEIKGDRSCRGGENTRRRDGSETRITEVRIHVDAAVTVYLGWHSTRLVVGV